MPQNKKAINPKVKIKLRLILRDRIVPYKKDKLGNRIISSPAVSTETFKTHPVKLLNLMEK